MRNEGFPIPAERIVRGHIAQIAARGRRSAPLIARTPCSEHHPAAMTEHRALKIFERPPITLLINIVRSVAAVAPKDRDLPSARP
jgi:hypothetical protein